MYIVPKDYQTYVLDDIEKYEGLRKAIAASLRERLTVKKRSPFDLHPNPGDEFSQPAVGPNYEIVENYVKQFRQNSAQGKPLTKEPLMVEKMYPEGYLLLNGHHRWFAALRLREKSVPIQIVNLVHEDELKEMINKAQNHKRAVFDLDEVLFIPENEWKKEKAAGKARAERFPALFKVDQITHEKVRLYAPALLRALQKMGYDIWVYTAGYYSAKSIQAYFKLYHVELQGIVNGVQKGRKARGAEGSGMKKALAEKYNETLHIDTNHVLRICREQNDYDYITLEANGENWASKVVRTVRKFQKEDKKGR